jgi:hypothetical protein
VVSMSKYMHFRTERLALDFVERKGYDLDYYTVKYFDVYAVKHIKKLKYPGYYIFSWKKMDFLRYEETDRVLKKINED